MFQWSERGCRKYQIRMEDRLAGSPLDAESDPELAAHLRECSKCREAFGAAELSGRLFAGAETTKVQPSEAFVTRVMASVREAEARMSGQAAAWRPLEALASRFSLVAAMVLLALSVFLGEFSPALRQVEVVSSGAASGTTVTSDWPEPPAQPATQDEVLMSLVGVDNGI
jgi:predicted anti-sigma-YlaC factor YlaD